MLVRQNVDNKVSKHSPVTSCHKVLSYLQGCLSPSLSPQLLLQLDWLFLQPANMNTGEIAGVMTVLGKNTVVEFNSIIIEVKYTVTHIIVSVKFLTIFPSVCDAVPPALSAFFYIFAAYKIN